MTETALSAALAKAGIPPADIAFLTACRKLADLALRAAGPASPPAAAVAGWLQLAAGHDFRSQALLAYLTAVAATRPAGTGDRVKRDALVSHVPDPGAVTQTDGAGHSSNADHSGSPRPGAAPPGGDHTSSATHSGNVSAGREPGLRARGAAKRSKQLAAKSIFDRHLGLGDLVLGNATKLDFVNLRKKGLIVTSAAERFLTDIDWPDEDATPLRRCATEAQAKAIMAASYRSLDALGVTRGRG